MRRPKISLPVNFITLHYSYILGCTLLAFLILGVGGNLRAIDAFFFAASANTESGLNTVNVNALHVYQQLVLYFFPIVTNLGFINIAVVIARLYWFEKRLSSASELARRRRRPSASRAGDGLELGDVDIESRTIAVSKDPTKAPVESVETSKASTGESDTRPSGNDVDAQKGFKDDRTPGITWAEETNKAWKVPSPREQENGVPLRLVDATSTRDEDAISVAPTQRRNSMRLRRITTNTSRRNSEETPAFLPSLSKEVTIGRNSSFHNLTPEDREALGGLEYRSLKLLLKIIIGYFFGIHIFGALCLAPWIHNAPLKYREYLASTGSGQTWWAFYSAQTMVDNLGFTLTPDSMITFADATWPMLVLTFLAYAGNTCYPILLRLVIWTIYKVVPARSSMREPLRFLLDHPRRCYTLLFPGRATWALFAILFALNFVDTLIIVVLDLHNPAVDYLPGGPRVLAALFQAASSRHTGTATFNLADVNPAVQFSLLVMMYISVFPIAFAIRATNTYEEKTLGQYGSSSDPDNSKSGGAYLMAHLRNQLGFDLWYIFLGSFCICISEARQIADVKDPAFSVFSVLFETTSAYANVGLSLGYPTVYTSLSGKFTTFSKVVICAMMIRGRHRGLPNRVDKAIVLPMDHVTEGEEGNKSDWHGGSMKGELQKARTM